MTDIIIRDLDDEEYLELLRRKKRGDSKTWRDFFLDKMEAKKNDTKVLEIHFCRTWDKRRILEILEAIEAEQTVEEIAETYPDLNEKDVKAAIRYATKIVERESGHGRASKLENISIL